MRTQPSQRPSRSSSVFPDSKKNGDLERSVRKRGEQPLTLGGFIRAKRLEKGLSLRQLAKAVNVAHPFLSNIEQGKRNPPDRVLPPLAKALNIPLEQLVGLNTKAAFADFKRMLRRNPELSFAFSVFVRTVEKEQISPHILAQRFRDKLRK